MDLWNNLRENMVSIPNVNSFENRLYKLRASQERICDFEAVMNKLDKQVQNATITVDPEPDLDLSIDD